MLVSPIGGPERKVADNLCGSGSHLAWSGDSQWLACEALGDPPGLILVPAASGEVRRLTTLTQPQADRYPAFSPDGKNLLFVHSARQLECDLELLELNSDLLPRGPARRITNEHAAISGGVTWTADGREAVWSLTKASYFTPALYRVPVFRGGPLELLSFSGRAYDPVVARHGNRLAYTKMALDLHIWRADGHTAERHPVSSTQNEYAARLSPDGRRIAFVSDRSGPEEIWVANADGSQPVQLTSFGWYSDAPCWSPDGRWIAFESHSLEGRWDIWVMDAAGGTPRQLTKGPGSFHVPSFSHDGRWVYFYGTLAGQPA